MEMLFRNVVWLTALVFVLTGRAFAAQPAAEATPVQKVDGSFVREWLVLGPFPAKGLETDFLADAGGEANVRPKEGDTVVRRDGTRLTWTRLRATSDNVSLEKALGVQQWAVAYAYCELGSDQQSDTDIRAANEGNGASVLLNGEIVGTLPPHVDRNLDIHALLPVRLRAGRNPCLIKSAVAQREWTFVFQPLPPDRAKVELTVTDPASKNVAGAQVEFYENNLVTRLKTDQTGQAIACFYPAAKSYDLRVTSGMMGAWLFGVAFQSGEGRKLAVTLHETTSVFGQVTAMDGSPQSSIVVQALFETPGSINPQIGLGRLSSYSETVLTDTNGAYHFVNLHPGEYRLRCHAADEFVFAQSMQRSGAPVPKSITVGLGRAPERIDFAIPEIKKGVWKSYPITQGLIEVEPKVIHRTSDGMLWIGTSRSSLFSYDGVEFKMVASAPEIPGMDVLTLQSGQNDTIWIGTSSGVSRRMSGRTEVYDLGGTLPRNTVNDVHVDGDGTVWFATASGLVRHDSRGFTTFSVNDGLPSNAIGSILRARDGFLYVLTESGLVQYDGSKFALMQPFERLTPRNVGAGAKDGRYSWLWTQTLRETKDGSLWFGTQFDGAYRYDGKVMSKLRTEDGLLSNYITSIAETSDGALWFGSPEGLSRFDGKAVLNYTEKDGLGNRFVCDLAVDSDDVIWCATKKGISRFDSKGFLRFTKLDGMRNRDGETAGVLAIEADSHGGPWVGTEWGGLFQMEGQTIQPATSGTERQYVRRIYRGADGTVWLGMPKGIFKYENGKLKQVLARSWVIALSGDKAGNLWYGQGWNGGGLTRFNPNTGEEKVFLKGQGLPDDSVWAIEQDSDGGLWLGTSGGLARYRDGRIEDFRDKLGVPTGGVFNLRRDENSTLWIGSSRGLHRLEVVSKTEGGRTNVEFHTGSLVSGFKRISITTSNGLPDQPIWCSAQTGDGIIWMGTDQNGLIGYDGRALTVIDKRDGLLGNQVLALAKNGDDSLWVGTLDGGLNRFKPSKVKPSVRLREVKLDDQTFTNFSKISRMQSGHRVTIQYQEIDQKTHPDKRQFWYRLATSSGTTVMAGTTRDRRFEWTPQEAGSYAFEVQAIDRDLNYSAPARLSFHVSVPWFANMWILGPSGVAFAGLFAWAFISRALYVGKQRETARLRDRLLKQESEAREALERKSLQLEEARQAAEKAKEAAEAANEAKSTFLATMSHEIRTPLNAILGFSDLLNRVVKDPKERSHVTAISSSGRGLLTIINDILDLSKIEAGRLELHYEPVSLQQLLTEVAHVFSQKTEEKGIVLEIKLAQLLPGGLFLDPVRLRQILFNVVGNAVKFTDKGVIRLSAASKVSESDTTKVDLILTVSDSGIGIPAGELDRIFDMFTQVSGQNTRSYGGTGLGLSITKRLTEMLGGTLRVESEVGRGSTFYFDFPGVRVVESPILPNENERPALNLDQFRPSTILIAEDHSLNWKLLWAYFDGSKHHLIMATNGREAIEVARKERPDLILMDIRMPEMGGWEALSVLKHDPALKTIPVIMISASISGDETGRNRGLYDAFLRKPVMMADLVQTMALFLPRTKPSTAPEGEMGKPESGLDSGLTNGRPVSPELISLIDAQLAEVWPRLCDRPNIAQIKKFAMRLEQWASTYGVESLLLFAQSLHQQADQFDLEHLFQTLRRFPDIRESLMSPGFKT